MQLSDNKSKNNKLKGNKVKKKKSSIEKPILELTLRKYEAPADNLSKRELIKKLCLSLGLLQPNDARDAIVDVFQIIIEAKRPISAKNIIAKIEKKRKKLKLPLSGLTYPNISRQLRKLKQMMLIESYADKYRLNENDSLKTIFNEKIIKYYVKSIQDRINNYIDAVEKKN